jgi:NhaP-type Na+/H+ and K+/H+ antiporter
VRPGAPAAYSPAANDPRRAAAFANEVPAPNRGGPMKKQKPVYTKAQHQILNPAFVEKKIQLHKNVKWTTKDQRELFMMLSQSVTRYVPNSDHNNQMPMGFTNLQMGHYNKISIHSRDFRQMAQVFQQIADAMLQNADKLDQVLTAEMDKYQTHHLKNLLNSDELP